MNAKFGKVLYIVAIVFMGLTAAMNVLGGIGTVCAAFLTKKYPPMWVFQDYLWLYRPLMIITIIIGIVGVWATARLVKGGPDVYKNTLIVLVIGTILGGTQFFASLAIRGKAVPANVKFFTNVITLLLFLALKAPAIRDWVDFSKPGSKGDKAAAGGFAAFISGIVTLTTFIWAGPSHTYMGDNWVEVFETPILVGGTLLVLGGVTAMIWGYNQVLGGEIAELRSSSSKA